MLPLARAFAAAGHDVLWAAGEQVHDVLRGAGISAVACGTDGVARTRGCGRACGARRRPSLRRTARRTSSRGCSAPRSPRRWPPTCCRSPAEWRPDLLVHENGELASPLVGAVLGVPSLTHAFGGPVPARHLSEAGERLSSMWAEHGLEVPPYAGCFESVYLDICPPRSGRCPWTTSPTSSRCDRSRTRRHPLELRRTGPPLVYVTMGTVQNRALDLGPLVARSPRSPSRSWSPSARTATRPPGRPAGERAGRALGRPAPGARAVRRGRLPRRVGDVPGRAGRTGCRSCASRRPPTSSATPRGVCVPARRWR